jgi:hypothetical protein
VESRIEAILPPIPKSRFCPPAIICAYLHATWLNTRFWRISFLANPCNLQFDRYSFMELTLTIRYKIVIFVEHGEGNKQQAMMFSIFDGIPKT